MKKLLVSILSLLALTLLTGSWGWVGHTKISTDAALSYNQQMHDFSTWTSYLAEHSSDADNRKSSDPNEAPRHYIDIDGYISFLYTGQIPQTLDSVVNLYGNAFVYGQGILPWATLTTFDSLQSCFQRHDFERAKYFSADLGHYVGDGHMPLHITQNYNGESTGNNGIHSRYESTMVGAYVDQIIYTGDSISVIPNVNQYIFNYLYKNYTYVDSVLQADDYAKTFGSTNSAEYKQALWDKSKVFTTLLMKNASHALTELIFTAWVNAGSPSLTASAIGELNRDSELNLENTAPNPFSSTTAISYKLREKANVLLQVRNSCGSLVTTLDEGSREPGNYKIDWNPGTLVNGVYLLEFNNGKSIQVRKIVHLN